VGAAEAGGGEAGEAEEGEAEEGEIEWITTESALESSDDEGSLPARQQVFVTDQKLADALEEIKKYYILHKLTSGRAILITTMQLKGATPTNLENMKVCPAKDTLIPAMEGFPAYTRKDYLDDFRKSMDAILQIVQPDFIADKAEGMRYMLYWLPPLSRVFIILPMRKQLIQAKKLVKPKTKKLSMFAILVRCGIFCSQYVNGDINFNIFTLAGVFGHFGSKMVKMRHRNGFQLDNDPYPDFNMVKKVKEITSRNIEELVRSNILLGRNRLQLKRCKEFQDMTDKQDMEDGFLFNGYPPDRLEERFCKRRNLVNRLKQPAAQAQPQTQPAPQ
jgi:hypothetical protein